ncbi:MAG: RAMP superfamily CRISPR-associated protein [Gordonia sp. (in: high G+C Gram-positive bacteria)]
MSPLHIGSDSAGNVVDLVQFVDGKNRPTIPGTSLAGALRTALAARAEKDDGWGDKARASAITIFDAHEKDAGSATTHARHSVAIDRHTGTAVDKHLYSREVVAAGSKFRLRIIIETRGSYTTERAEQDLKAIVEALTGTGFAVGASTSRGLGQVRLQDWKTTRRTLDNAGIRDAILAAAGRRIDVKPDGAQTIPHGTLRIMVPWQPLGPVMSKVELDGGVADARPLVADHDNAVRMVIPGSSIKGVIRSHAERIARTAAGADAPAVPFLEQMKATGLAGIADLFGLASDDNDTESRGRRGAVTVHEVSTEVAVRAEKWRKVAIAATKTNVEASKDEDMQALAQAITSFNQSANATGGDAFLHLDVVMRNSIDRWTGGTADGRLFSTIEAHATWKPIVLDLDVTRLRVLNKKNPGIVDASLALLLFLLIDACAGWLAVGYATTRGLGSFTAAPSAVTFEASDITDRNTDHVTALVGKNLGQILADEALLASLTEIWNEAVVEAHEAAMNNSTTDEEAAS